MRSHPGGRADAVMADAVMADSVRLLRPVPLDEVVTTAALQQRVDRKYLVGAQELAGVLRDLELALRCLEIGSRRQFGYDTVYFDTADLRCFRDHVQGRRLRAKVRARTYTDSAESAFEVKAAGPRALTVKRRMPWSPQWPGVLTAQGRDFARTHAPFLLGDLLPAARTSYRRSTLLVSDGSRVTVDVGLRLARAGRGVRLDPGTALVETKTAGPPNVVDRALVSAGVRPQSVSKYCLAIALLERGATSNPWHRTMRRHFGWRGPLEAVVT